ncbi:[protein-PII] uridylyltransferase, partial [Pseudomonas aeruginosa]
MPQVDPELFDRGQFQAELALKSSPIAAFKKAIRQFREVLDNRFNSGRDIRRLIEDRAWCVDQILQQAWQRFDWGDDADIALVAVGGYGRGELHPYSDVDLLILLDSEDQESFREPIEGFLTLLWDIGLEVGQSVRSVQQCAEEARADLTVITTLMECRTICGPDSLRQRMLRVTGSAHMWPSKEFFLAKRHEQQRRHAKYNDTEYNLEPNVKGSPGGLRDIQTILWMARRQFGSLNLHALVREGFLVESECSMLASSQEFLWRVRYALHMLAGRAEDRLLFDHQRSIARLFGYEDNDVKLAVERFMQKYYRVVMAISELNDLIIQHFEEVILPCEQPVQIQPLNSRFQLRDGYIEVTHPNVFKRTPFALLEIFVLMAQHPEIKGVRADTIRLLRDSRHLIDDEFRHDIRNTSLFIELFKSSQGIHRNLRRMNRYGILGRYLPEFGHIIGQMQHDLFHIYTVDAHTLNLIKHLRKLNRPEMAEKYPLASKIIDRLPKPELIYIAGLYHDIAKGRGGDHSELGAVDAEAFCQSHQLPLWDTQLVSWLVQNHLVMSTTAQRKDLSDPQVIFDFAQLVGDQTHLDYLYVLTVADINATNPTLWNSWRASLLRQLYTETKRALRRGLENPVDREEQIRQTQTAALDQLVRNGIDQDDAEQLWSQLGDDYFLRHTAGDVAWHTEAILQHPDDGTPLVLIKETTQREFESGSQIFIYAADQHDFFAVTVAAMDQLNLSIQDARIITSTSQFTLDT